MTNHTEGGGIERYEWHELGHDRSPIGGWVLYADHLDALGEVLQTAETLDDAGGREVQRLMEERTAAEEALAGLRDGLEEAKKVNVQLLGEREGVRKRRPDLSRAELEVLLAPEDEIPTNRTEYLRGTAREKLSKALEALQEDSKKPELSKCAGLGYKGGVWREGVANEPCPGCSDCQKPELSAEEGS